MRSAIRLASIFLAPLLLVGCTTAYQRMSMMTYTGGYEDKDLGKDVFRVTFAANGSTTRETAQSFWLWRCSELTLERGFDGFEILSDMRLAHLQQSPEPTSSSEIHFERASYVPIYVPIPTDQSDKPLIVGDIHLLHGPITEQRPKLFDAQRLKDALKLHVEPAIKSRSNVEPHIHDYLLPDGKLDSPAT